MAAALDDTKSWELKFMEADLPIKLKREKETFEEGYDRLLSRRKQFFDSFPSRFAQYERKENAAPLGRSLTEDELLAFETKGKLRLPHDVRQFLKQFGNGGFCKPSTGVPLTALDVSDENAKRADLPFPWQRAVGELDECDVNEDDEVGTPGAAIRPELKMPAEDAVALFKSRNKLQGTLTVAPGYYLVLNGTDRGLLWAASSNHIGEVYMPCDASTLLDASLESQAVKHGARMMEYAASLKDGLDDTGAACDFISFVNKGLFKARNFDSSMLNQRDLDG